MECYKDAAELAELLQPEEPVFCLRPQAAMRAARWFCSQFPGRSFYAVKANPARWLLTALRAGGIEQFDVASIEEIRLVREVAPDSVLAYMNPVKSVRSIREAYFEHGVRIFSLDAETELDKILTATEQAKDLTLCVRIGVSSSHAKITLAEKFGANWRDASALLLKTRQVADRLGVCFHVGSQSMSPTGYAAALDQAQRVIVRAGAIVDILDVGGGFPSVYPNMVPPPLIEFVEAIERRFEQSLLVVQNCELWCEPGRALAAESSSLVVRVEKRRENALFINDGVYGALFDAGCLNWTFPVRNLRNGQGADAHAPFCFYGPTCDSHDHMKGPFLLPEDTKEGDYLEIGMLGAYGAAMGTRFNGFGSYQEHFVADPPMHSLYAERLPDNVVPIVQDYHG